MNIVYPVLMHYKWEKSPPMSIKEAHEILEVSLHTCKNKVTPRSKAYALTRDYLITLADTHEITTCSGKQLKKLLVMAATETKWYSVPSKAYAGNSAWNEDRTLRYCLTCSTYKEPALFCAPTSSRKIKANKWDTLNSKLKPTRNKAKRIISMGKMCTPCRQAKNARELRKIKARAVKSPYSLMLYQINKRLCTIRQIKMRGKMQNYYVMKREALIYAKNKLKSLCLDDDALPPDTWEMLLTLDMRAALFNEHNHTHWVKEQKPMLY